MSSEISTCLVCGEDKDVRNHYGVVSCYGCKSFFRRVIIEDKAYRCKYGGKCVIDKNNRNRCRACRFEKCKETGMRSESLRDANKMPFVDKMVEEDSPKGQTREEHFQRSTTLIEFLGTIQKIIDDNYDPRYAHVTEEDIIAMDKIYGRHVSLAEGIRNPELVAPRTRMRWTKERLMIKEDIAFCWYRTFVMMADYANMIPQFRQLSSQDQCQIFKHNFATTSWLIILDAILQSDLLDGFPFGNGAYAPTDILNGHNPLNTHPKAHHYYSKLLIDPFKELDQKEFAIFKTLLLFQNGESLSERGLEITQRYNEQLLDALWDYQAVKNPELSVEERMRRHSKILLLIPKITQAWHLESDLHLLMSVFGEVNMDGIPKELLFHNINFEIDYKFKP